MAEPLLEVKNLQVTYGSGRKAYSAVQNASFTIYKGETFGLVGESGSGKTTIGRAILRILPTTGGEILYKGQRINGKISRALDKQLTREIQMIFQDPQSSLNERAKVSYIVGEGLQNVRPELTAAQREEKVRQALLDVGLLPEFASRFPHEFSGGMRQRVVIAIALACNPKILLCDEPTTALDVTIQAQILQLLRQMRAKYHLTIVLITHDLGVVANLADRVAVMYAGDIVEIGTADEIYYDPRHPYTWGLLSAMPDLDTADDRLYTIPGSPPNLLHEKPGDAFAPRNRFALNIDDEIDPPMFKISDTHYAATWLLDPRAPKVEMPPELKERIARMKAEEKKIEEAE